MIRRRSSLVLVLGALLATLLLLPAPVSAGTPSPTSSSSGAQPPRAPDAAGDVALSRLVAACHASARLAYRGVQEVRVSTESTQRVSVVDVAHVPGQGLHLTVHASDGRPGGTYVGTDRTPSLLPVLDEAALGRIASRYATRGPTPGPEVAGRPTDVVELVRRTGRAAGTVAARFWLDRATALPLRREAVDGAGRVQQASTYTSVDFPDAAALASTGAPTQPTPRPLDAAALDHSVGPAQLEGFRRNGWLAPETLPGDYELVDARVAGTESLPEGPPPLVLRLTYTDGIAVVSLWEQRGRLDPEPLAGWTRSRRGDGDVYVDAGTPQRVVWSARGSVYTLVGDEPEVVDDAMAVLPQPTSPPGLLDRLGSGLRRLGSWLNPFG